MAARLDDLRETLRHAVVRLRFGKDKDGYWEGATAFMVSPTLALTAYHNRIEETLKQRPPRLNGVFRLDGREAELVFEVIPEAALVDHDVAALRLVRRPENLDLGFLQPAWLPPQTPLAHAMRHWAGSQVMIRGFPFTDRGQGEREVLGTLHAREPLQELYLNPGFTLELRVSGNDADALPGISGAPICLTESGLAVGVQHSYIPRPDLDVDTRLVLGTPLCRLAQGWPGFAKECPGEIQEVRPRQPSGGRRRGWLGLMLALGALVVTVPLWLPGPALQVAAPTPTCEPMSAESVINDVEQGQLQRAMQVVAARNETCPTDAVFADLRRKIEAGIRNQLELRIRSGASGASPSHMGKTTVLRVSGNEQGFRLVAVTEEPVYVYLFGFDEGGEVELLFPVRDLSGAPRNPLSPGHHTLPTEDPDYVFSLNGPGGRVSEVLALSARWPARELEHWADGLESSGKPGALRALREALEARQAANVGGSDVRTIRFVYAGQEQGER